ncbi:LuxR family transcriptional regulator [Micromonospora sp. WMMA2032]|uniref:helix-turn-helix transcriptional regulator n=1 Tax=Micromonospora sp. WMMA2032 TaxID=2039870 RepID=UPI000C057FB3|nr:LuxR family transcriptional regulator [Micromonospora sp. WMMA2032]ATO13282.1 LuxR family transcriptional regulator [Micromonospora sp. WMMA2032]
MTMAERDRQFDVLTDRLADLHRADGPADTSDVITVVTGPVGVGKTALLQSLARRCAETGVAYLGASASRSERTVPLEVIRQLVRRATWDETDRERVGRLLDRAVLRWSETSDEEALAPLTAAIGGELLDLATRTPTLIAVDDVQHADVPSLRCLDHLARRVTGLPVLIVLTEAPRTRAWHPTAYAELLQPARLHRIRLPLLSADGTFRILAERLGVPVARRVADEAYRISGGNPLLVHALADDHPAGADAPVPGEAFREAVLSCLYRCELLVLKTARVLAVTEEPLHGPLLPHLLDLPTEPNLSAVDPSTSAGLVTADGLRHPTVRRAVLDGMTVEERARLHRAAAQLLHDDGAPPTRVAPHLLTTDELTEPWMAQTLLDAGEQTLTDGDVDTARRYLRRANRDCPDECLRARIRSALARAEWRLDPQAAVPHLHGVATAVRAGHLGSRQAAGPIQYLLWHGQPDRAVELIHHLGERADSLDTHTAVDLMIMRGWMATLYPGAPVDAPAWPVPTRDPLALARVRHRLRGVLLLRTVLERGDLDALEDAERTLATLSLDDEPSMWSAVCAVIAMIYADRLDLADEWCDRLDRIASARRHRTPRALLTAVAATVAGRRGDLHRARELADSALNRLSPKGWGVAIGAPLAVRLWTLTRLEEWEEAAACLRTPVPPALFETPFGLHYLHARGLHAIAAGSPEAALADFQLCGQLMTSWRLDLAPLVPWRTESARALLQLGRRQQAEKLVREELDRLRPTDLRWRGIALRVLGTASEGPDRIRYLRGAVRLLRQCGARVELAHALGDLGQAQQQAGDLRQARSTSRAARDLAEDCGIPALRPAVAAVRTAAADPDADTGLLLTGLSDAESRVAALAAQGHTNREIAERMFLTVSAIEQRLTRIYRKLDVHSRSELAARLRFDR